MELSLRQECVLAVLLHRLVFIAVLCVAEKRVLADAAIMDVQLQRNSESGGNRGDRRASTIDGQEEEEAQALWEYCALTTRILYRDHLADCRRRRR